MASEDTTTHRTFVSYIDRTRKFYAAQGYERPYRWAHFEDVPFTPLIKPIAECRLALITTASPLRSDEDAHGVRGSRKQVWSGRTNALPEALYTDDLAWDKASTHTDDVPSFLPIPQLLDLVRDGRLLGLTEHFHGVPTDYSQRRTSEEDAPEILERCRGDATDIALLVPL